MTLSAPLGSLALAFSGHKRGPTQIAFGAGIAWTSFAEATNGAVAQALAAAGRGVAVVSDDPRYNLVPTSIELPSEGLLSIRLVSTWDSRHAAAGTLEVMADRLSRFVTSRYDVAAG